MRKYLFFFLSATINFGDKLIWGNGFMLTGLLKKLLTNLRINRKAMVLWYVVCEWYIGVLCDSPEMRNSIC